MEHSTRKDEDLTREVTTNSLDPVQDQPIIGPDLFGS